MLFSSFEFIFLFLPAAIMLHFFLARYSITAAIIGTTLASLVFYAWWNPNFLALPVLSILGNFALAYLIVRFGRPTARVLMIVGIAVNLALLCHYKYSAFLLSIFTGESAEAPHVPLALSFTTFVQIAFLVYVYQRRISLAFGEYALFVSFFPHLIAGPVVRWGSLGHQIQDKSRYRLDWENVALGLTIFAFGLGKKVLIADHLAPHVSSVFEAAARGDPIMAAAAWGAVLAFIAQIYFDFSGYSDMAIGLGLLFNFRLPINFAAPLRSMNMFDLWRRWHVTVCRLARDLIYVPIARAHPSPLGRNVALAITMMALAVWHGAGWTFVAWGVYNVALLLIVQLWWSIRTPGARSALGSLVAWALTFTAFVAGGAFFRAPDLATSLHMLTAMAGFGNAPIPETLDFGFDAWGINHGYLSGDLIRTWLGGTFSAVGGIYTALALAIALLVPDTLEIVNYREGDAQSDWRRRVGAFAWRPSFASLAVVLGVFTAAFLQLNRVSEFLYYQF